MIDIRHPDIRVQLTGEDGNAFMIIGLVQRALRDAGASEGRGLPVLRGGDLARLHLRCSRPVCDGLTPVNVEGYPSSLLGEDQQL
jgi:hypothetical protein